jgi:hypothetical protein
VVRPLVDGGAPDVPPDARRGLEKEAVRHLLSGRLPEAASAYRALAVAAPGEPIYETIARVIEVRLGPPPSRIARDERRKLTP